MRPCVLWALLLAVGCGAGGPPPPSSATFDTFTLTLEDAAAGQELRPLDRVKVRVTYRGDLARNLRVTATLTDTATGESVDEFLGVSHGGDDTTIDQVGTWVADAPSFEKPGRYEVTFTASIVATLKDSQPWTTSAPAVFVVAAPRLDSVEVTGLTVGAPTPYGTPLTVTVKGNDLWHDVKLSLENVDLGQAVAGQRRELPSDSPRSTLAAAWTI